MLWHRSFNWLIAKNYDFFFFFAFLLPIGICFLFWNLAQFQVLQSIFKLVTNLRNFCLLRIHKLFLPTLLNWAWKTCFAQRETLLFLQSCTHVKPEYPLSIIFLERIPPIQKPLESNLFELWFLKSKQHTYTHIELPNSSTSSHDKKL